MPVSSLNMVQECGVNRCRVPARGAPRGYLIKRSPIWETRATLLAIGEVHLGHNLKEEGGLHRSLVFSRLEEAILECTSRYVSPSSVKPVAGSDGFSFGSGGIPLSSFLPFPCAMRARMYRLVARVSHGWCCLGIGQFNRSACHRGIPVGTRRTLASPMLLPGVSLRGGGGGGGRDESRSSA